MSLCAGGEQQRAHRGRLPGAQRRHRRADELHGVVDRQARCHHAAGRVDVHRDFLLRIFRLEEQELRDGQRRHAVFDRTGHEDDALFQQPRENVVGAFAAVGLLDHHRDEVHVGFNGIAHGSPQRFDGGLGQERAEASIPRRAQASRHGLPRADERPVMQDFNSNSRKRAAHRYEPISRRQDRAIASRIRDEFKLIRRRSSSGGYRRTAAFAVHH